MAFTIFRDDAPPSEVETSAEVATPSPMRAIAPLNASSLIVFRPDKENIDPLTGLRSNTELSSKKRKTNVLATKIHAPPLSKKAKESKDSKNRVEKTTSAARVRVVADKKRGGSKRVGGAGPSRARRSPSLPRVVEEVDERTDRDGVSQGAINSRCYELTVLPLADISEAYEAVPSLEADLVALVEDVKDVLTKALEVGGTETSRGVSPVPVLKSVSPVRPRGSVSTSATPEREGIHSTFTFSSPSPSGKRYAASKRLPKHSSSDAVIEVKH
ncbi:hypothetical protein BKA93DRAFT_774333 [Sparassis latifolia]